MSKVAVECQINLMESKVRFDTVRKLRLFVSVFHLPPFSQITSPHFPFRPIYFILGSFIFSLLLWNRNFNACLLYISPIKRRKIYSWSVKCLIISPIKFLLQYMYLSILKRRFLDTDAFTKLNLCNKSYLARSQ